MQKLLPYIVKFGFVLFILGVFGAMMLYSWQGLANIFPNDLLGQIFGMIMFDIAALIWFGGLIYLSRSISQYVIAFIGFMIGLLGTLGLIGIEVGLSSGMLEAGTMQKPLTYIFIAVLVGHIVLIYAHHAAAPEMSADISMGIEMAKIVGRAEDDASKRLVANIDGLSRPLADKLIRRVMEDLRITPASGMVIDLPALDVNDPVIGYHRGEEVHASEVGANADEFREAKANGGLKDFLLQFNPFSGNGAKKYQYVVPNVDMNLKPVTPKQSPAQTDAGSDEAADDGAKK